MSPRISSNSPMLEAMSIELETSSGGGFTGDTVGVFIIFSSTAFFTRDTL